MSDVHRHLPGRPARNGSAHWRDEAACRGVDPELFFPVRNAGPALRQIGQAKQVCARCPVRMPCLEWALDSGQEAGGAGEVPAKTSGAFCGPGGWTGRHPCRYRTRWLRMMTPACKGHGMRRTHVAGEED